MRVRQVLAPAGREVVDDRHVVAPGEERVDEVRPDEAGAACDESLHTAAEVSSRPGPGRALLRSPRMRGLFVTFEGIDRSGKTTQARLLTEALGDEALGVREPGGTPAGERVRDLLKDAAVPLGAEAEALLFAAARAELVARVIRPALEDGRVVVSDRFLDSSLAYQGGARGLGVDEVERINRFATGGLVPDLTFLLEIDPAAAARARGRERPLRGRGRGAAAGRARGLRAAGGGRTRAAGGASTRPARPSRCTPRCSPRSRPPAAGCARERRAGRHRGPPAGAHRADGGARGRPVARLPLPRAGRDRQAHGGARVRGRAARRGPAGPGRGAPARRSTAPTPT